MPEKSEELRKEIIKSLEKRIEEGKREYSEEDLWMIATDLTIQGTRGWPEEASTAFSNSFLAHFREWVAKKGI